MNRSFQSYSPRTRAFYYNALNLDVGCQDVLQGKKWNASLPFSRICTFAHDSASEVFNRSDQVSYTTGPQNTGGDMPWSWTWVAWVSSYGVRVARREGIVPPSNEVGVGSSLFPDSRPKKLALGFTTLGQIAIAIQESDTNIRIKWFTDDSGSPESIGTIVFAGYSPVFFNNGLVYISDDEGETDLVLYYLRDDPRKLYARFERDGFSVERLVHANLQVQIATMIESEARHGQQVIYLRDNLGRDSTLYSPQYSVKIDNDARISSSISFIDGIYDKGGVLADANVEEDTSSLAISFVSGSYESSVVFPAEPLPESPAEFTITFSQGAYN